MSIRAVDLATTLQQTQHAERVSHLEHGQTRTQQHQFAQSLNEAEKHKRESVAEAAEQDGPGHVDENLEREKRRQGKRGERDREEQEAAARAALLDDGEPHIIDLRA